MTGAAGIVWVTGASTGLGRAVCRHYAAAGRQVVGSARSAAELDRLAAEAGARGRLLAQPLDITDRAAVHDTVAAIESGAGPIGLAVLNAGTHRPMTAESFDAGAFESLVRVNLLGTVNCLEALMPRMMARRSGQIAVVASVAGYRGLPSAAAYGASKAALINMTESLRFDLDRHGVRIRLIDPGFVRTPLTGRNPFPMPFLMEPDAAAARIRRGLEGGGFEITFPRRFTWGVKLMRLLPYALYFPLVARITRWH